MSILIEHKGIATILETMRLEVPTHQRPFEWEDEQIRELLEDIEGGFDRGKEEYFLGSVVVIAPKGSERHSVLDGQQRLAAVSLVLTSIADAFDSAGEQNAADTVRRMLESYDIDQGLFSPHLRLNQDDDPFFRGLLKKDLSPPMGGAPQSHRRLFGARQFVRAWIESRVARQTVPVTWLKEFTKYLRGSVRVIYFGVPDDANAYLIFETMNDRGLDLSIADLLKNYFLGRAGDQTATVLAQWSRTQQSLKAFGFDESFKIFLRHYWASRYEVVREKELYRHVKDRVTSATHVLELTNDLARNAYHYTAILSSDHEYWTGARPESRDRLRTLELLGLEQFRPMFLAALAHFELHDVEEILRLLESWNVRLVVVGGLGGGVTEAKYAELGRAIREGEIKSVKDLRTRAAAFVPGDLAFQNAMSLLTVSRVALARYYLRSLEVVGGNAKDLEKVPSPSLTLEHILPERPASSYPDFTDEERMAYTRRLGNLVLLTHKVNSELKSAPFDQKREEYRQSSLKLTREVAEIPKWTPAEVNTRQQRLAELALKTWPLNPR